MMGTLIGLFTNHPVPRPLGDSILTALLAVMLTGGAIAIFALEGVICLLMAAPIAIVAALMGAVSDMRSPSTAATRSCRSC